VITPNWYKAELLNPNLSKEEIAIHSGLNVKTINNMFNSTAKHIVIDASNVHYDILYASIQTLVEIENELELTLTIKFHNVSVDLNISETLIVINTLAVKRVALRGGLWSTAGKRVEKPLMQTLCKLYSVPSINYKTRVIGKNPEKTFEREIDFYLCNEEHDYKCEVKLMGRGNPESADAVIARDSRVFIADKLSNTNKAQLNSMGVGWVELRDTNGYKRFKNVLEMLHIPYTDYTGNNLVTDLDRILGEIFI